MERWVFYDICPSPIGELLLTSDGSGLTGVMMATDRRPTPAPDWIHGDAVCRSARGQLEAYFAGTRQAFDVPLAPQGTAFQQAVWRELCAIPYGVTISYSELARRIGRPTASRAVGAANGQNPVAIIVPCHRVIAADGTLGGFGGGLDRKSWLLQHEAAVRARLVECAR